MHPVIGTGRVDHCGALTLASKPAEWIDATRINFGNTTYYRNKPEMPRGVPIWTFKG